MDFSERVHICLEGFDKNIQKSWKELQFKHDFCDMALASEGKLINVHKVVISANSPVLNNILKYSSHQNPFIYLTGVKYEDLQSIVTLMYQGKVSIAEENLDFFLEVAENLKIKGFHRSNRDFSNFQVKLEEPFDKHNKKHSQTIENYTGNNYGNIQKSIKNESTQNSESSPTDCSLYSNLKNMPMKNNAIMVTSNSENVQTGYDILLNKKVMELSEKHILEESSKIQNYEDNNYKSTEVKVEDYIIDNLSTTSVDYCYIENINNEEMGLKTYFETVETKAIMNENKNTDKHQDIKKSKKYLVNSEVEFRYCKVCDKKYRDKFEFKDHVKMTHHNIYICHLCDSESPKFFLHKNHIEQVHKGVHYQCNQCDYKTTIKGNLSTHIKTIHEGLNYPCGICDYKATQSINLKRHKANVHLIGEDIICDQCDFKARTNQQLTRHVRVKHKNIKDVCDKCNKMFTRKDHLRVHMDAVHNNIRFQCDQCEHKTTQKGDLSRHKKRMHTTN